MTIIIASILLITLIAWVLNKKLSINICPICVGVFLTWVGIFVASVFNILSSSFYQLPIAILMGGTVVGLMYKLEKHIKIKFILIWKIIFVIIGFFIVYNLVIRDWLASIIGIFLITTITFLFKKIIQTKSLKRLESLKDIKEKMKNCC